MHNECYPKLKPDPLTPHLGEDEGQVGGQACTLDDGPALVADDKHESLA
jgi:hypothetical protein